MLRDFVKNIGYDDPLEASLSKIEGLLSSEYGISKRSAALMILQEDPDISETARKREPAESAKEIFAIAAELKTHYSYPLTYIITERRQKEASRISSAATTVTKKGSLGIREAVSRAMMNPFIGGPILLAVMYYGLYKFVGNFGAGVLVDFLEDKVFDHHLNPFVSGVVDKYVPWAVIRDLIAGDYGVITLGFRYAFAIIMPIVATFFFAFAVIEDSGYLPRLAMLVDQIFKKIGLSGRAIIPLVLGLGCSTMATMVTRTLPTKRERIIATLLLALAIPCSAQMGVILALLESRPLGLIVWLSVIVGVFLFVGYLASKIMPGELPSFYMEIPPLRFPQASNVLRKTASRMKWYFLEVLPLFMFASVMIWLGQITGVFGFFVRMLEHPVRWIGLPSESAVAFLFGFFRRDYGAAGLYDLKTEGLLGGNQLVVACVTLTLFLPCVAQLLMNIKERGMKVGIAMSVFILFFSFSIGWIVNMLLSISGLSL